MTDLAINLIEIQDSYKFIKRVSRSPFHTIFSARRSIPYINYKLNFKTFIVAAPFLPCSETAAEWHVKRSFRTRAQRARDFAFIVPEALVKGHPLIGPLPRSSGKNYVPASAATRIRGLRAPRRAATRACTHTHAPDTRAH